ncbi:hypothetical protein [Streptomyces sp. NPDC001530]|uniref:hypothetical protein n=1 Tax=Streptomyces sp. NPDC001530 TaxID=3364582 RepID=UPI00367CA8CB
MTTRSRTREALRVRAGYGQLLLLAALLFGIVTMHTLGHPSGHSPGQSSERSEGEGSGHFLGQVSGHVLVEGSGHSLGEGSGHSLGQGSGHAPGEGSGGSLGPGSGQSLGQGSRHSPYSMAYDMSSPSGRAQAHTTPASPSSVAPPMTGMDPLSVCLAVLGGFTLVLLLAAAMGRPWASGARPPALARLLRGLWPKPPPQRTLLSRLSVLRI